MSLRLPDTGAQVLPDGRRRTPSAERNAGPILEVLRAHAPATGRLLEIASGSGFHAARMAAELPGLDWQPTDLEPANFRSIAAWAAQSTGRIRPAVELDATRPGWGTALGPVQALLLVNLLHLIPEAGVQVLLAEVPKVLAPGGIAFIYGPFLRNGQATSPGDAAFDASLRAQDSSLGYKDLAWVTGQLAAGGLAVSTRDMPANNVMLLARA